MNPTPGKVGERPRVDKYKNKKAARWAAGEEGLVRAADMENGRRVGDEPSLLVDVDPDMPGELLVYLERECRNLVLGKRFSDGKGCLVSDFGLQAPGFHFGKGSHGHHLNSPVFDMLGISYQLSTP
jgi:hypothetical protein